MKKIFSLLMLCFATACLSFAVQTVTLKVTVSNETEAVFATGSFNGWSTTATPMTLLQSTPTKIFSAEVSVPDNPVDSSYNFKFLAGPGWDYEQSDPATDFVYGQVGWDGAIVKSFKKYAKATDCVSGDVTINVLVPTTLTTCYITGNFNNWNGVGQEMTYVSEDTDGKIYTTVIDSVIPLGLEFKFLSGPGWAYEQTNSNNYTYANGGKDGSMNVVCGEFKAIYDPINVGDVNITITSYPEGTDSVYLCGSFQEGGNWKIETAPACTKLENGNFKYVLPQIAEFEYKFWLRRDWAYEEAADAEGNGLSANRKGSFKTTPNIEVQILFWKKMPSGIKTPTADYFSATVINNIVYVDGYTKSVSLYTVNGQQIDSKNGTGNYISQKLNAGIYLLNVDGYSKKFIIK